MAMTYTFKAVQVFRGSLYIIVSLSDGSEAKFIFTPEDFASAITPLDAEKLVSDKISAYLSCKEKFNAIGDTLKTKIGGVL